MALHGHRAAPAVSLRSGDTATRRRLRGLLASQGSAHGPKRLQSVNVRGASPVTPGKAKKILRHGSVHGKALSQKQQGLFGVIASGKRPRM